MLWAQIVLVVLFFISLLLNANSHGKPISGTHNFWSETIGALITYGMVAAAGALNHIVHWPK